MATLKDLASKITNFIRSFNEPLVIRGGKMFEEQPQVQAQQEPQISDVERKMRAGFRAYADQHAGGKALPIEKHIPQFVEAAEKYPIFKQNPYLLPQSSILESSAGLNVTRENNPLNWGARIQKQGLYSPQSWEQSIQDAITAIAGDVEARPPTQPTRHRQTTYYEPFRRSGDLRDFANIYEPANPDYHENLLKGIEFFERQ